MSEQSTAIPKAQSQFGAVWQQFRVHRGAVFGLIVLGLLAAFVIFGPLFWPEVKLKVVEALKVKNQGPSLRFPFGTDQLGRDMMVRMMAAGKVSLAVGFVAMIIAIFVGTGIGILAGYFKRLDGPLMRMTDLFLSLPLIPLLLVLVMLFRDTIRPTARCNNKAPSWQWWATASTTRQPCRLPMSALRWEAAPMSRCKPPASP